MSTVELNTSTENPPEKKKEKKLLETMQGIFIPTASQVLGTLIYVRHSQIIGQSGVILTVFYWLVNVITVCLPLMYIFLCILFVTIKIVLTICSVSALATNGKIEGGGLYYLLSRSLGPELGGAAGLLFCMGNAMAASMEILGFAEILLDLIPWFNPTTNFNRQIIGLVVLVLLMGIVVVGMKLINKFEIVFLFSQILAVLTLLLGTFFQNDELGTKMSVEHLQANMGPNFSEGVTPLNNFAVYATGFIDCVAGITRSGQLKNPSKSIPRGSLSAHAFVAVIYLIAIFLFGASGPRESMKTTETLMVLNGWPLAILCQIGVMVDSLGSSLQFLSVAPRILQSIANDDITPTLRWFKGKGEPRKAMIISFIICAGFVSMGELNIVTPFISLFLFLVYTLVNGVVFLMAYNGDPNFRPRWKFWNKYTALAGMILCIIIMFVCSWYFALAVVLLTFLLYKYFEQQFIRTDWGDSFKGLNFTAAKNSLLSLESTPLKSRNWRPQMLVFVKLNKIATGQLEAENQERRAQQMRQKLENRRKNEEREERNQRAKAIKQYQKDVQKQQKEGDTKYRTEQRENQRREAREKQQGQERLKSHNSSSTISEGMQSERLAANTAVNSNVQRTTLDSDPPRITLRQIFDTQIPQNSLITPTDQQQRIGSNVENQNIVSNQSQSPGAHLSNIIPSPNQQQNTSNVHDNNIGQNTDINSEHSKNDITIDSRFQDENIRNNLLTISQIPGRIDESKEVRPSLASVFAPFKSENNKSLSPLISSDESLSEKKQDQQSPQQIMPSKLSTVSSEAVCDQGQFNSIPNLSLQAKDAQASQLQNALFDHTLLNLNAQLTSDLDTPQDSARHESNLVSFAQQLTQGSGLVVFGGIQEDDPIALFKNRNRNKRSTNDIDSSPLNLLRASIDAFKQRLIQNKIDAFVEGVCSSNFFEGVSALSQCVGIGQLKPNLICLGWPVNWRRGHNGSSLNQRDEKQIIFKQQQLQLIGSQEEGNQLFDNKEKDNSSTINSKHSLIEFNQLQSSSLQLTSTQTEDNNHSQLASQLTLTEISLAHPRQIPVSEMGKQYASDFLSVIAEVNALKKAVVLLKCRGTWPETAEEVIKGDLFGKIGVSGRNLKSKEPINISPPQTPSPTFSLVDFDSPILETRDSPTVSNSQQMIQESRAIARQPLVHHSNTNAPQYLSSSDNRKYLSGSDNRENDNQSPGGGFFKFFKNPNIHLTKPRRIKFQPTIDIWWIMFDVSPQLRMAMVLQRTPVWSPCKLRLFTVAGPRDDMEKMKRYLREFLDKNRIDAELIIIQRPVIARHPQLVRDNTSKEGYISDISDESTPSEKGTHTVKISPKHELSTMQNYAGYEDDPQKQILQRIRVLSEAGGVRRELDENGNDTLAVVSDLEFMKLHIQTDLSNKEKKILKKKPKVKKKQINHPIKEINLTEYNFDDKMSKDSENISSSDDSQMDDIPKTKVEQGLNKLPNHSNVKRNISRTSLKFMQSNEDSSIISLSESPSSLTLDSESSREYYRRRSKSTGRTRVDQFAGAWATSYESGNAHEGQLKDREIGNLNLQRDEFDDEGILQHEKEGFVLRLPTTPSLFNVLGDIPGKSSSNSKKQKSQQPQHHPRNISQSEDQLSQSNIPVPESLNLDISLNQNQEINNSQISQEEQDAQFKLNQNQYLTKNENDNNKSNAIPEQKNRRHIIHERTKSNKIPHSKHLSHHKHKSQKIQDVAVDMKNKQKLAQISLQKIPSMEQLQQLREQRTTQEKTRKSAILRVHLEALEQQKRREELRRQEIIEQRMQEASMLNQMIVEHSAEARLVLVDMPRFGAKDDMMSGEDETSDLHNKKGQEKNHIVLDEWEQMVFIESIIRNLNNVIIFRGSGGEVVRFS